MAICSRLISTITICGIACHSSLALAANSAQVSPPAGIAKPVAVQKNSAAPTRINRTSRNAPPLLLKPDTPKLVGPDGKAVVPEKPPGAAPDFERFPTVGKFEILMFGSSTPSSPIEARLDKLELSVFQSTFPHIDVEQRISHLKSLLLGQEVNSNNSTPVQPPQAPPRPAQPEQTLASPDYGLESEPTVETMPQGKDMFSRKQSFSESELAEELPQLELEKFALTLLNEERSSRGLAPLQWDNEVSKMAQQHVAELSQRGLISHYSKNGENPDLRWTKKGGTGMFEEGLVQFSHPSSKKANKGIIVQLMDTLASRQDDREALFSPHATNFAAAYAWSPDKTRLIFCTATVTNRAHMHSLPETAKLGEKIELKGEIHEPYQFARISVAWEGHDNKPADGIDDSDEAMPYFPPLDYIAYAERAERDWQKTITVLQIAGITAAIAGGFFMPPVALAAPLIAAGGMATVNPRPLSDIPVKGGVKLHGKTFSHKIPLSHNGKDGIYYITIWAKDKIGENPVPISRRALVVTGSVSNGAEKTSSPDLPETASKPPTQAEIATPENKTDSGLSEPLTAAPLSVSSEEPAPAQKQDPVGMQESVSEHEPTSAQKPLSAQEPLKEIREENKTVAGSTTASSIPASDTIPASKDNADDLAKQSVKENRNAAR